MSNSNNITALINRLVQLQQTISDLEGVAGSDDRLAEVRAEFAACRSKVEELGVKVTVHPHGGVTFGGGTTIGSIGTLVGGDQYNTIVITEEESYRVAGLPNPYLGLRPFTADEQEIFGGREGIVRELVKRLAAEDGDRLLFLVGASGSGKSSLAQAGLLPALKAHLCKQGLAVEVRILGNPGRMPATSLRRILHNLSEASAPMLLLLIDQFEELFIHAEADEAQQALNLLLDLAGRSQPPLRMIATLRSDFLPQLVADARFEPYERRKQIVRAMSEDELADAIQRPVQVRYPDKRLEPGLVKRLARDAMQDAAYLPLLQVTLEDLWRGGDLRLAAYAGLSNAIQHRADLVYNYRDYDESRHQRRTPEEQASILAIFLALVRVSLKEGQAEVRWRRSRIELTQGDPQRERLIIDLAAARLLRTDRELIQENGREREVDTVDIVHEALLHGWPILGTAISNEREVLRQRARFDLALAEWNNKRQSDNYLLAGVGLAEAEALKQSGDGMFQKAGVQEFFERSVQRRNEEQQRQMRQARLRAMVSTALALVAVVAAVVAVWFGVAAGRNAATALSEKRRAEAQATAARSRALVAESLRALAQHDRDAALSLALMAARVDPQVLPAQALLSEVAYANPRRAFVGHRSYVRDLAMSPDGSKMISASWDGTVRLWDVRTGAEIRTFTDGADVLVNSADLNIKTNLVAADASESIVVWDIDSGNVITRLPNSNIVEEILFSPEGDKLAVKTDGVVRVWNVKTGDLLREYPEGFQSTRRFYFYDNDRLLDNYASLRNVLNGDNEQLFDLQDAYLIDASDDFSVALDNKGRIWDAKKSIVVRSLEQVPSDSFGSFIGPATLSGDGKYVAYGSWEGDIVVWEALTGKKVHQIQMRSHTHALEFGPSAKFLITGSFDGMLRLWDITTARRIREPIEGNSVSVVRTSVDGSMVAVANSCDSDHQGSTCNKLAIFRNDGSELQSIAFGEYPGGISAVDISEDGKMIAAGRCDSLRDGNSCSLGGIIIWDMVNDTEVYYLQGHESWIKTLRFSKDGKYLLSGSLDNTIRTWDLVTGQQIKIIDFSAEQLRDVDFSPDQTLAFIGDWNGKLELISLDTGNVLLTSQADPPSSNGSGLDFVGVVRDIEFSPNGKFAISSSGSNAPILWDVQTKKEILRLNGYKGVDWVLSFSPDSQFLASSSTDGVIRLWDVKTGQEIRRYAFSGVYVTDMSFSNDGTSLFIGYGDGSFATWPLDLSLEGLMTWTCDNRYIPDISAETRQIYDISGQALCPSVQR